MAEVQNLSAGCCPWFMDTACRSFVAITMIVAIIKVHAANGLWSTANGYEYNLTLLAVAVGLAMTGPGQYSIHFFI